MDVDKMFDAKCTRLACLLSFASLFFHFVQKHVIECSPKKIRQCFLFCHHCFLVAAVTFPRLRPTTPIHSHPINVFPLLMIAKLWVFIQDETFWRGAEVDRLCLSWGLPGHTSFSCTVVIACQYLSRELLLREKLDFSTLARRDVQPRSKSLPLGPRLGRNRLPKACQRQSLLRFPIVPGYVSTCHMENPPKLCAS